MLLRTMAMIVQGVMAEVPKMVATHPGIPGPASYPLTWAMPKPKATETPKTMQARGVRPSFTRMRMPFNVMVPKTLMVAPPITGWGIMVRAAESLGTRPAARKTNAAPANTQRLMTRLETMMPTF